MARKRATRKEVPSHIMLCLFLGRLHEVAADPSSAHQQSPLGGVPVIAPRAAEGDAKDTPRQEPMPVDVPSWTPLSATVSGPKFFALSQEQQTMIKRIHSNLGHPTAQKLSKHLRHVLRDIRPVRPRQVK